MDLRYGVHLSAAQGHYRAGLEADGDVWVLRADVHLQMDATPPATLGVLPATWTSVCPDAPAAWIISPESGIPLPYQCDCETAKAIALLQRGEMSPEELDPVMHGRLRANGLLVRPAAELDTRLRGLQRLKDCASSFASQEWTHIPALVESAHQRALQQYYRGLHMDGYMETECSNRLFIHSEPVARFFHQAFRASVEWIVGQPVKPSYCFSRVYLPGARQPRHIDRDQCVWNVSWLIDDLGAAPGEKPWPLMIDAAGGRAKIGLQAGEAVLFPGAVPHQRYAALPSHRSETLILFHYVPRGYTGPLV